MLTLFRLSQVCAKKETTPQIRSCFCKENTLAAINATASCLDAANPYWGAPSFLSSSPSLLLIPSKVRTVLTASSIHSTEFRSMHQLDVEAGDDGRRSEFNEPLLRSRVELDNQFFRSLQRSVAVLLFVAAVLADMVVVARQRRGRKTATYTFLLLNERELATSFSCSFSSLSIVRDGTLRSSCPCQVLQRRGT